MKDPFKTSIAGLAEEIARQDRERRALFENALTSTALLKDVGGVSGTLAQIRELQNSGALAHIQDMHRSGTLAEVQKIMQQNAAMFGSLRSIVTPSWMAALRDASLAVTSRNAELARSFEAINSTFSGGILGTAKLLNEQRDAIASAFAATRWQEQLKTLAEQLAPNLAAFRSAAEQMADTTLLAAAQADFYRAASLQTAEIEQLVDAMAHAATPQDGTDYLVAAIGILASLIQAFVNNSRDDLRKFGIMHAAALAGLYFAIFPPNAAPTQAPAEASAYTHVVEQVVTLSASIKELLAASQQLDEAYVADLPRAALSRGANIRGDASGKAPVIWKAPASTALAVKETKGKWRFVVFRDPLTDQLAQGWVYGDAVELAND